MNYRIKDICKDKVIAIGVLADKIGLQRESLSRIISGANTSTETLEKIAAALGVDITDLFDRPSTGTIACPNCGTEIKLTAEKV